MSIDDLHGNNERMEKNSNLFWDYKALVLVILAVVASSISLFLPENWAQLHCYIFTATVPFIAFFIATLMYIHSADKNSEFNQFILALAISSALNWLAEITWEIYEGILKLEPFPSLADVFWIFAYIPLLVVSWIAVSKNIKYISLKAGVITAVFNIFVFSSVIFPLIKDTLESPLTPLEMCVSLTYPVLDTLVLFSLSFLLVLYIKRALGYFWAILILAYTLVFIGDVLFSYYIMWDIYYAGSLPDVFFNLYYSTIALGLFFIYGKEIRFVTIEDIEREREKYRMLYLETQRIKEHLSILNKILRHDIQNDLTIIKAYLDLIKEQPRKEFIDKIDERLEHSLELIKAIRSLERMIEHKEELKDVNLSEVLLNEVKGLKSWKVDIRAEIPDNVYVRADEMITSVLQNILLNAIFHNDKENPRIDITVKVEDDWVEIRIADNGPGIPDEIKEEIFKEGFKGEMSGRSGLGLYIVKRTVERYGGMVWVEDNKPEGSVFVVRLKRSKPS